ncbi:MAG: radical SAM protein [Candidatus Aminicenantes bacterium]|nr:MAG: radical SAM protein [Candidatus Aminicenantes bacterium]
MTKILTFNMEIASQQRNDRAGTMKNFTGTGKEKVLLALLPFWAPLIPPIGIASLKQFLQLRGFKVKTVDANIEFEFREIFEKYFQFLRTGIPGEKIGNLYNIGYDVLRNHMMAHLNSEGKKGYLQLLKDIISKTFYCNIDLQQLLKLKLLIDEFYHRLEDYLLHLLDREKPGVIGLSVYEDTLPASLFALQLIKKRYPQIETVIGGGIFADQLAMGSPNLEYFLERTKPYIDKIIIGEGEILFYKLLCGDLPGSQRVYTLKDIGEEVLDLSSLEVPDFSDFKLQYYSYSAAHTSRSCPFQCAFCSETIQWGKYRKKEAVRVAEELTRLYREHNKQLFYLCDSLLNPGITGFANELVKSDISIYWEGYLRADKEVCDPENIFLWRRGGFYRAWLGVESGSRHVLDLMDKRITVEQIKAAVSGLAYAGIKTSTLWIVGYPGETGKDFQQTLDLLEELSDDIYEVWCSPFNYYLSGQVKSHKWAKDSIPLYPGNVRDILMVQTWILNLEPSREEAYKRMNRLIRHCKKLGIPTPYSLHDIYEADKRWKKLHKNAVPAMMEFKEKGSYIDECKRVSNVLPSSKKLDLEKGGDFLFQAPQPGDIGRR